MKRYKHTIVIGPARYCSFHRRLRIHLLFMVEHIFLSLLMVFCISCALAVEREV